MGVVGRIIHFLLEVTTVRNLMDRLTQLGSWTIERDSRVI